MKKQSHLIPPMQQLNRLAEPTVSKATDQHYIQAMELLVEVVQALSLARDLETITAIVRQAARDLTQADGASFVLKDGDFCFYVDESAISPLWKGRRFPQSICIGGWCMRNQCPVVIPDVENDERIPIEAYRPTFIKSLLMVPIRTRAPIGAIGTYWADFHEATPEEIRVLQALADTTSVALENVQVYTELENRVRDRTAELETANRELAAFAYTLSHDLRTPLTSLNGFNYLLKMQYSEQLGAEGKSYLEHMNQAVQRIHAQVDGMLSLHQINHAELESEQVDFSTLAHEILLDLKAKDRDRPIKVVITEGLTAYGDPVLLQVVLENLLSNAWKYSAKTAASEIAVGYLAETQTFYVKDNGAGFNMQDAGKLFEPFQRLHHASEFEGTGVGLASVARIVERHGGRIWAESAPQQGATFFFTLAASPPQATELESAICDRTTPTGSARQPASP